MAFKKTGKGESLGTVKLDKPKEATTTESEMPNTKEATPENIK